MTQTLEGKVAVITGGAGGFGKAIAKDFVGNGAQVVILDVTREAGETTADEIGVTFELCDVTRKVDWERVIAAVDAKYGKIDIVVNNAGTTYANKPTTEVTEADFDKVFDVNVKSIYHSTMTIVPYMKSKALGGSFVNIASTAGIRPRPGLTWYNASKAAVITATKTMAVEYASDNIRFNSVCPVVSLNTGLSSMFLGGAENEQKFTSTIPLGRGASPEDVANTCVFLCSQRASFLTGIDVPVDGGRCV
ncbi:hypothetical protein KC367_g5632 [Hortaea werneckii]|uniref:Uncharacterized protein n=2 Tax=Hortaea werneckii TaxID=91943 RepID=A0A3M7J8Q7_HORWE|nr:hypothetical protein KC358_g1262 [Hortaea werneckii]OTA27929.1 hypothetical protein BTJ68_11547 [Hortaea werneckii EXF-2000]KAI6945216.1 hypothetical protein KC341_g304 [Hortaea werneckii]KAI6951225.1 hypothetical protein KC348_g198 [Hortaea werneckii]KAI7000055.1 hypothetical protein KC329_g555 [Hortaea werneckii]